MLVLLIRCKFSWQKKTHREDQNTYLNATGNASGNIDGTFVTSSGGGHEPLAQRREQSFCARYDSKVGKKSSCNTTDNNLTYVEYNPLVPFFNLQTRRPFPVYRRSMVFGGKQQKKLMESVSHLYAAI